MNSVAILYICTGEYDIFWKDFYLSCESYFLPNSHKEYFVFTDAGEIYSGGAERVHKIYQESLGWPDNTLMRFHMFLGVEEELKKFDYIFFMNANCQCVDYVPEEDFLPRKKGLLVVKHPAFYDAHPDQFTYDRNPRSKAYIPFGSGTYYVFGAINGGAAEAFLRMAGELKRRIDCDKENGVIALWHDESHLNRYLLDEGDYEVREPEYCYPEDWEIPFHPRILIREKRKWIDVDKIKGAGNGMVIVKFLGGLGNQMFQYAFYKRLLAEGKTVFAELNWYSDAESSRSFQLLRFPKLDFNSVNIALSEDGGCTLSLKLSPSSEKDFTEDKMKAFKECCVNGFLEYTEKEMCFQKEALHINNGYLVGYWQSPQYFETIRSELLESFTFPELRGGRNLYLLDQIRDTCSVAVHVRRGDYLSDGNQGRYGGICTESYYRRAMQYFEDHYQDVHFFVFSNDMKWVKQHIRAKNVILSDANDEAAGISDMYLMTQCRHHIIANSSFSWWGAWLCQNEGQEVVAPEKWLNDQDVRDIWCEGWIKMGG